MSNSPLRVSPSGPVSALIDRVLSVFGRSGAVIAEFGDYLSTQIANDSIVPGVTVSEALDLLYSAGRFAYTVGPANVARFQTIQSAIDAAEAAGASGVNNAVIFILGGQWNENLVFNSGGIHLLGVGYNQTYILGSITYNWPTQALGVYSLNSVRVNGLVTHQTAGGVGTKRFTTTRAYLAGGISFSTDVSWNDLGSSLFRPTIDGVPAITGALNSYAFSESNISLTGGAALAGTVMDCTTSGVGTIYGGSIFGISNQTNNGGFRCSGVKQWEVSAGITPLILNTGAIRAIVSNNAFVIQAVSTAPVIVKNGSGILHQGGNIWIGQGSGPSPMIQVNAGSVINAIPVA